VTFDMNGMGAACQHMTLMDHFLLLRCKIKPVLKIKISNLLLKQTGRIFGINLLFVYPWIKSRINNLASHSLCRGNMAMPILFEC